MSVGLIDIAIALPSQQITSAEIAARYGFELDFIEHKLGISSRRHLNPEETVSGLATRAIEALITQTQVSREQIDVLLVVTQTPDYQLPQVSALVQADAGLSTELLAVDLNLGCSGYVVGLSTLKSLMTIHQMRFGILITVDAYSRIIDPSDRATAPIFGDAATATLFGSEALYELGEPVFGSDGAQSEALIVHGSGSTLEASEALFMDGRSIYNFALRVVPKSIEECLTRNDVLLEEVDCVVLHQANFFMVDAIGKHLGVASNLMVKDMKDVGNTTSSSIPIALKRKVLTRQCQPNNVLISGFGVGLAWATNFLFRRGS